MEHTHSIVVHSHLGADTPPEIYVFNYEGGKQVGDMRVLPLDHPARALILSIIDAEHELAEPALVDVDALTRRIVDYFIHDMEDPDEPHALTTIKLEIERALAGIAPPNDGEAHTSNESPESAAVATEDITDTRPLSASE